MPQSSCSQPAMNKSPDRVAGINRFLFGFKIFPASENSLSVGTDVHITHKYLVTIFRRLGNLLACAQNTSGSSRIPIIGSSKYLCSSNRALLYYLSREAPAVFWLSCWRDCQKLSSSTDSGGTSDVVSWLKHFFKPLFLTLSWYDPTHFPTVALTEKPI